MVKNVITSLANKMEERRKEGPIGPLLPQKAGEEIKVEEIVTPEIENPFEGCGCINCKLGRTEDNQQIPIAILRNAFPEGYIDQEIRKKLPEEHREGCTCMNCRQTRVEINSSIITEYFRKMAGRIDLSCQNLEYTK